MGSSPDGRELASYGDGSICSYRLHFVEQGPTIRLSIVGRLSEAVPEDFVLESINLLESAKQWRVLFDLSACEHLSSVSLSLLSVVCAQRANAHAWLQPIHSACTWVVRHSWAGKRADDCRR